MNFIAAIQRATIGYGIRRRDWHKDAILTTNNFHELTWMNGNTAKLLGPDQTGDMREEDIKATDWETV